MKAEKVYRSQQHPVDVREWLSPQTVAILSDPHAPHDVLIEWANRGLAGMGDRQNLAALVLIAQNPNTAPGILQALVELEDNDRNPQFRVMDCFTYAASSKEEIVHRYLKLIRFLRAERKQRIDTDWENLLDGS